MIKSGYVNQKRGGGFEQGYPSQKYPKGRDEFIRPYVDNTDETILRKSSYSNPMDYKNVTPSPVQYNDIFRKKPTPDERLYILKQIQQGLDKVQKGILGKIPGIPPPSVPPPGAPSGTRPTDEVGQTIGAPPAGPPPSSDGAGGILIDDTPDIMAESPTSDVAPAEYDTTVPQVPGESYDPRQNDGVDEVNAALNADELAAVPLTMDQVTEDVVTGNRSMIADMPGAFPNEDPQQEESQKDEMTATEMSEINKQEAGEIRSKPPTWFQASRPEKDRKAQWRKDYDRKKKAESKYGKPEMSSAKTPTMLPPSLGRRPSK